MLGLLLNSDFPVQNDPSSRAQSKQGIIEKRKYFSFCFQKSICGNYQLFFSNHDANLLWFYPGLIHHIIKELVYSSYIHVSDEQHKITCELKSNKTFVLKCLHIRSDDDLNCPHACSLGWRMVRSWDFDRWPVQQ